MPTHGRKALLPSSWDGVTADLRSTNGHLLTLLGNRSPLANFLQILKNPKSQPTNMSQDGNVKISWRWLSRRGMFEESSGLRQKMSNITELWESDDDDDDTSSCCFSSLLTESSANLFFKWKVETCSAGRWILIEFCEFRKMFNGSFRRIPAEVFVRAILSWSYFLHELLLFYNCVLKLN